MIALRLVLVALVPLTLIGASLARPAPAQGCSAGDPWDPIEESEMIVGGWIGGYTPLPDRSRVGMFTPVRLEMRIDHVWKGRLPPGAEIVDRASLMLQPVFTDSEELHGAWAGPSGACGAFDEDPSGHYAVVGLVTAPDGTLQTMRLRVFYLSRQPYDPADVSSLSRRIGFPIAGHGVDERSAGNVSEALLLAGAALWAAGVAMFVRRCANS